MVSTVERLRGKSPRDSPWCSLRRAKKPCQDSRFARQPSKAFELSSFSQVPLSRGSPSALLLTCHFLRFFIIAQPQKNRVPELSITGPFGVTDLCDQLWRDERHILLAHIRIERRALPLQADQFLMQGLQRLLIEAGAHLADVLKSTARVNSQQQRPEEMPRSRRLRESADDKFIFFPNFHLQPRRRAPRNILRRQILRDQSLETLLLRNFKGLDAVRIEPHRKNQVRRRLYRSLERGASLRKRRFPQILAIAIDTIENRKRRPPIALLQKLKPRNIVRIKNHDLAVQRQRVRFQLGNRFRDLWIARRPIDRIPRDQRDLRTFFVRQHAHAVVFLFVYPPRLVKWRIHQCGEHGSDAKRYFGHRCSSARRNKTSVQSSDALYQKKDRPESSGSAP